MLVMIISVIHRIASEGIRMGGEKKNNTYAWRTRRSYILCMLGVLGLLLEHSVLELVALLLQSACRSNE